MTFMDMISSVGFPIAIAVYLLVVMKRAIDNLTKSVDKLIELIDRKIS